MHGARGGAAKIMSDDPLPDMTAPRWLVAGVTVKECTFPWLQKSLGQYMKRPRRSVGCFCTL